jgi:hypothetical protein
VGRVGARDLEPLIALGAADEHGLTIAQLMKPLEEMDPS